MKEISKPTSRFPGISPFSREQFPVLFGRKAEVQLLYRFMQMEQVVVLFGSSGSGKTSLIHAGLFPLIEKEENTTIIPIRLRSFSSDKDMTLVGYLKEHLPARKTSLIDRLDKRSDKEKPIWAHLKSLQTETEHRIILVFDQIEELAISKPTAELDLLKQQLAELALGKTPVYYRNMLRKMYFHDAKELTESEIEWLLKPLKINLLFVIRSEFLGFLANWSDYFPTILKNSIELKNLSRAQALEALTGPANAPGDSFRSPTFQLEERAKIAILEYLDSSQESISPLQVQVIGEYLEQQVMKTGNSTIQTKDLEPILSGTFLDQYLDSILSRFTSTEQFFFIEILGELISHEGERLSMNEEYFLKKGVTQEKIDQLTQTYLIRKVLVPGAGSFLEITHDAIKDYVLRKIRVLSKNAG